MPGPGTGKKAGVNREHAPEITFSKYRGTIQLCKGPFRRERGGETGKRRPPHGRETDNNLAQFRREKRRQDVQKQKERLTRKQKDFSLTKTECSANSHKSIFLLGSAGWKESREILKR